MGKLQTENKISVPNDALIRKSIENISSIGEDKQDTLKRLIDVSLNRLVEKMQGVRFLKVNPVRMKLLIEILYKMLPSVCFRKT